MPNLNKVMLIGHICRDPEVKYIASGTALCEFSIGVNRYSKDKDGNKREEVCFVDIIAWSKLAETICQYVKKGDPIFVEGHLQQDSWEGKDGTKRTKLKVNAESVQFLRSRQTGAEDVKPEDVGAGPPYADGKSRPMEPTQDIPF